MTAIGRVAIFISSLGVSGRERTLLAVADTLAAGGTQVDILTPGPTQDLRAAVHPPVNLVDINGWWMRLPWLGARNKRRVYLSPPALSRYLRRAKPDVLLSGSIPPNLAALAAKRLARVGTRVIVRHSNALQVPGSSRFGGIQPRPRDRCIPALYPYADAVIAVSDGVADSLVELLGQPRVPIHIIYNQNITPDLASRADETIDHPWFQPGMPPVILGVGRFVAKKDFPTLLRAFARLRAERDVHLVLLGRDGPERARIDSLIKELHIEDAVDVVGFRSNPFAYMARASVFALSSRFEGMPNVLVEALACGCPIVSTDCPSGPAEILEYGTHGRLVPMGDDEAMTQALAETLDDPPDKAVLRSRAEAFSVNRAVEQYITVIESVINDTRSLHASRLGSYHHNG